MKKAIFENKQIYDEIDVSLINLLSEDASMTGTELAEKIGLSIPATNKRIMKLVESGVIRKRTIIVDPEKVGKPLLAFVQVILENINYINELEEGLERDPDFLECYATTGEYDYLIKVRAKGIDDFENKLVGIKRIKGVVKTNTMFSLCIHKEMASVLPDF